ncbi:ribosomal-processing cysteine protease Prp [Fontibacillus sp. BL9]|uniref:ribosomal-processing cysteine protease Prp n=1 Tax=Fontibacillus sp. BL9 TaxID=3389971 RepID=UPI00397AB2CA
MIIVSILRSRDNDIKGFEVSGHAGYAKSGQDIVCAGVSAVTVGTVNSIEALTGTVMDAEMKNGFLNANLPDNIHPDAVRQVQLLLSSMVVMLQSIEGSYGKYIQIKDVNI